MNLLKISSIKEKITPPHQFKPYYLAGHALRTQPAIGVQADIFVTVVALQHKEEFLLWISLDLIGMPKSVSEQLVSHCASTYGIRQANIVISFIHSHSTPEYMTEETLEKTQTTQANGYLQWVVLQTHACVDKVMKADFQSVTMKVTKTQIEGYYSNRNGLDKPADKEMLWVIFENEEGEACVSLLNFACHPTVLGPQNLYTSPDLAGYLARAIEAHVGGNCLVMLGAAGNMSNRLYRQGNDQEELIRVGDGIFKQLLERSQWEQLPFTGFKTDVFEYHETFPKTLEGKLAQLKQCEVEIEAATSFDKVKVYSSAKAFLQRDLEHFVPVFHLDLKCRKIEIGALSIFTFPGELFAQFGIEIKEALGNQCNLFWGYTYYNAGYFYNQEEVGLSFESVITNILSGTTEKIIQEIVSFVS